MSIAAKALGGRSSAAAAAAKNGIRSQRQAAAKAEQQQLHSSYLLWCWCRLSLSLIICICRRDSPRRSMNVYQSSRRPKLSCRSSNSIAQQLQKKLSTISEAADEELQLRSSSCKNSKPSAAQALRSSSSSSVWFTTRRWLRKAEPTHQLRCMTFAGQMLTSFDNADLHRGFERHMAYLHADYLKESENITCRKYWSVESWRRFISSLLGCNIALTVLIGLQKQISVLLDKVGNPSGGVAKK